VKPTPPPAPEARLASNRTQPAQVAPAAAGVAAPGADGWIHGRLAYPTGDPQTSALLLEKSIPTEVTAGKPYSYELKVTNISQLKLEGVQVAEAIPANIKLADMQGMTAKEGGAQFAFGTLNPGESKTVKVMATPTGTGPISTCSSVNYNTTLCMATNVVSPALKLTAAAPTDIMVCDTIPVKLVVTNNGTGTARNVRVENPLPAGMTLAEGNTATAFDAGTLAAGQSKEITFNAKVNKAGKYEQKATARADDGLSAEAAVLSTTARQPVLEITKTGPQKAYVGRPVTYDIVVKNKGDAPARETVITDAIPAAAKFEAASDNGRATAGKVQWALGELAPGDSKKVSVNVSGANATTLTSQATAQARCAEAVTASAQTEVAGIPALLLECVDTSDPIPVGQVETYVVTVTNQGSATATNVKIVCTLEDTMEFSSATGASRTAAAPGTKTLTFDPVATIAPKDKAEWRVNVKAINPGDVRFKIEMTADQLSRPVEETESTNFYE
jgi:uncharacterized repeat protein (TIGR01451 family)